MIRRLFLIVIISFVCAAAAHAANPIGNGTVGFGTATSTATPPCTAGAMMFDASFKYFCTSTNTWVQEPITSFNSSAFYVSTTGNDSNAGSLAAPFLTLGKCQTSMRAGSIKTCYIRGGTYNITPGGGAGTACGVGSEAFELTNADAGETWSYYPPDGYGTAIINGQDNGTRNGTDTGFCVNSNARITFNGLQIQNFWFIGIYAVSTVTVTNSIFHHAFDSSITGGGAINLRGPNSIFSHNYVHDMAGSGIAAQGSVGGSGDLANLEISNNFVYNTCTVLADCGGIYISDNNVTPGTGIVVKNNYVRDVYPAGGGNIGFGPNIGNGLYFDEGASNITATWNVLTGLRGTCTFNAHGGITNVVNYNFCDGGVATTTAVNINQTCPVPGSCQANSDRGNSGLVHQHNIMTLNSTGAGYGYLNYGSPSAQPLMGNNQYYNYGSGGALFVGVTNPVGGVTADPSPVTTNPLIRCWGAILSPSSPVFTNAVAFPAQPAGWDTPGFWGYPGFTMTQIGNPPSWPVTSGDGVTCTTSN